VKVSIITPTKNCVKYIEACIQSVLNQPNHDHIFVDGGSTDGTLKILYEYRDNYPSKIRVIEGKDSSAGDAWVKGMKQSSGGILGWLGGDDTLMPLALSHVQKFFHDNTEAMFVFGGVNYIDAAGEIIKTPVIKEFNYKDAVSNYVSIPCTSAFYRREVIKTVDPQIIAEQDSEVEYWIRVAKVYRMHRSDAVLSNFRQWEKPGRVDGFYIFSKQTYERGKRNGAGPFSKCARRYYLACLTYPLKSVIDPLFLYLVRKG
jgi:glycosyltransferase involved in cell wall biosynthesis